MTRMRSNGNPAQRGAVLIVVLWVLIILSLLVSTMAFEMQVEAQVTSYYRKRFKAQHLSRAGVEWAKLMLLDQTLLNEETEALDPELYRNASALHRGLPISGMIHTLGEGSFRLDLVPEQGRRNVNQLSDDDWREVLDQAHVPEEYWDELIDCFQDWVDKDDAHRLNGAESEDEFYDDRGYEVKNAPLDTVDELLLIKGFSYELVFGGQGYEEDDPPLTGIAQWLTAWGNGKININTATREVLLTLPEIDEWMVDEIITGRAGVDGTYGTDDDGWSSVQDVLAATGLPNSFGSQISTTERRFIRVTSIGEVQGVQTGIWAIFRMDNQGLIPVFWREEPMD